MSSSPLARFAHDLGLAAHFGGSLMGATSLNAAAAELAQPAERARASTRGWSRWAPADLGGLALHLAGSGVMLARDLPRVKGQDGFRGPTAAKAAVTLAMVGGAAWSGVLNRRMAAAGPVPVRGATEPASGTPPEVARTQRQLQVVQWANPLLAGGLVVLSAWLSEQQRTAQTARAVAGRAATGGLIGPVPLAVVGLGALALLARRRSRSSSPDAAQAYPAVTSTSAAPLAPVPVRTGPPAGSYAPPPRPA
jgi:hypothetical protein